MDRQDTEDAEASVGLIQKKSHRHLLLSRTTIPHNIKRKYVSIFSHRLLDMSSLEDNMRPEYWVIIKVHTA